MPPNDNIATTLIIQMMPLVTREFRLRIDAHLMLTDPAYAASVFDLVLTTSNDRLRAFALQLQERLGTPAEGRPPTAAHSASMGISQGGTNDATEPSNPEKPSSSPRPRYVKSLR